MSSSYDNDLRLNEQGTGDNSGSWGTVTNLNLEMIAEAFSYGTRVIANASTDNITLADGALDADRSMYLKLTGGGQACTVSLLPNTVSKVWLIENATSATLTFTQGSGANVAVLAGQVKMIATDGAGSGAIVYDLLTDVNLAGTTVMSAATIDDVAIDGKVITMTGSSGDTATLTVAADGALEIATTDAAAAAGHITLKPDGSLFLNEGSTAVGEFKGVSSDLVIKSNVQDKDILLKGDDGGAEITALTLDMSAAGAAAFNSSITSGGAAVKVAGLETIWVPAAAMYPSTTNGCSALTQVETTALRPDMKVLDFAAAADDFAQFAIAFPASWNEGVIKFQVFWTPSTTDTGDCIWGLQGVSVADGATIDVAFGTAVTVTDAGIGTVEDQQVSPLSGEVTLTNAAVDTQSYFQIFRDANAGGDTFSGVSRLLGIKLFFTTDAANDA